MPTYGKDVAIASGFGVEGMVLLDLAARVRPDFRVFTLDTEFLFPETYDLMDRVEKRYGIKVERVYSPSPPKSRSAEYGAALWSRDPDKCCGIRKVEPLKTKTEGTARLDHRHPPRPDLVPRLGPQSGVGCQISAAEDQPHRRLDFADGLEPRPQTQRPVQPAA